MYEKRGKAVMTLPLFPFYFISLSRRLLHTTLTLDIAMSALAHIGVIWKPMPKMCNTPAAKGILTTL